MRYFSERLRSARIMKGYSLQDLAEAVNGTLTKQALSKYEKGLMNPEPETLHKLCDALDVRPDYFTRESHVLLENVEFRKLKRLPVKEIEKIKQKTIDNIERYFELENLLGLDKKFVNPLANENIDSYEDVERAVTKLKAKWKIGEGPLGNVVELLEDNNIKVIEVESEDEFSGLSTWKGINAPVIVVNANMKKLDRKRFTVLHELGHILLNVDNHEEKQREYFCHAFAGAMLLPKDLLLAELGNSRSRISLDELIYLKKQFGVSIQAIMMRAKYLGIITEQGFKRFITQFSMQGLKKNEPGSVEGYEKSNRFHQLLLRAVAENIISSAKAAALSNKKVSQFREDLAILEV